MSERSESFEEWRERTAVPDEPLTRIQWLRSAGTCAALGIMGLLFDSPGIAGAAGWFGGGCLLAATLTGRVPEARFGIAYSSAYGSCLAAWIGFQIITDRFHTADAVGCTIGAAILALVWAWEQRKKRRAHPLTVERF